MNIFRSWCFIFIVLLLHSGEIDTFGQMENIVEEVSKIFKLDFIQIISENDTYVINEAKQLFKTIKSQVIYQGMEFRAAKQILHNDNSGTFVFGRNSSATKIILEELVSMNKSIFNNGNWFILNFDMHEELDVRLNFDSSVYFVKRRNEDNFVMNEVYDLDIEGSKQKRVTNYVGTFYLNESAPIAISSKLKRRKNLLGKHFRLVTVPFAKSVIITSIGKQILRNDDWSGIVPDNVNVLSQYLNFTYSIAVSRDGKVWKV